MQMRLIAKSWKTRRHSDGPLYANENFPLPVVQVLRDLGHDVLTSQDAGNAGRGVPDIDVLNFAISDSRAVLTINRRHFIKLHDQQAEHWGIVVCSYDSDFAALAKRIDTALISAADAKGALVPVNRPPH
jgi:hypothetical protein